VSHQVGRRGRVDCDIVETSVVAAGAEYGGCILTIYGLVEPESTTATGRGFRTAAEWAKVAGTIG
jgi:hypothetical protein